MGSERSAPRKRSENSIGEFDSDKVRLTRLCAEIKRRREGGKSSSRDFFIAAVRTISQMRGLAHSDLRMECLFDCGLYFYTAGDGVRAIWTAESLQHIAQFTQDQSWIRKAHTLSGLANADVGNLSDAVTHHFESITRARNLADSKSEVSGLINLGIALMYGGLYREAIPCFNKAILETRVNPLVHQWLPNALANLAQAHLYLEEYAQGMRAIGECLKLTPPPTDADSLLSCTIREFSCVQLALGTGEIEVAKCHRAKCSSYALNADSVRARTLASIASALCEIYGGSPKNGLLSLRQLLEKCPKSDWSRTDVLIALVKGLDAADQPEEALEFLHELLNHVRAAREKAAQSLLNKAQSYAFVTISEDLKPLEMRALRLRAKAAEREVSNTKMEMFERLAATADLKEDASGEHGYRVGRLSALLAEKMGWNQEACLAIDFAARLHDIGKIAMPDRILLTSERLQEAERHVMSTHTLAGAELLTNSHIPQLQVAEAIARFHHEWWNGEGYPSKRREKRIPIHARIVALADVFDALTHGRPYAEPWPMDRALDEIRNRRGTQFDPELTDLFLDLVARLRNEHADLDAYLGKAGQSSPFLQARHKIRLMLADGANEAPTPQAKAAETVH
jgi:putative two-component system response regulator